MRNINASYNNLEAKYGNYIAPLAMFFYMALLSSSVAGQKLVNISGLIISSGTIIFPATYMIIACITEVYGLKRTKVIIFTGAACNLFVSLYFYSVVRTPYTIPAYIEQVDRFNIVTTITANILLTSTFAYIVSEYVNAKIIAKLKILLNGRWFLIRAITSIVIATILDSVLMLPIILYNSPHVIMRVFFSLISIKIAYEILLLPVLWVLVEFLKKKEGFYGNEVQIPFSSVSYMLKEKIKT